MTPDAPAATQHHVEEVRGQRKAGRGTLGKHSLPHDAGETHQPHLLDDPKHQPQDLDGCVLAVIRFVRP